MIPEAEWRLLREASDQREWVNRRIRSGDMVSAREEEGAPDFIVFRYGPHKFLLQYRLDASAPWEKCSFSHIKPLAKFVREKTPDPTAPLPAPAPELPEEKKAKKYPVGKTKGLIHALRAVTPGLRWYFERRRTGVNEELLIWRSVHDEDERPRYQLQRYVGGLYIEVRTRATATLPEQSRMVLDFEQATALVRDHYACAPPPRCPRCFRQEKPCDQHALPAEEDSE